MRPFFFSGRLPPSKSMLLRLMLIHSHGPAGRLLPRPRACPGRPCGDAAAMAGGLAALARGRPADCGASGTALRFLAARASRIPGRHTLTGAPRLLERPLEGLFKALKRLGVAAKASSRSILVEGRGWLAPLGPVRVERGSSSQFASALLLNAWGLEFPLGLAWRGPRVSEGYWEMSLRLAEASGMRVKASASGVMIPPLQSARDPRAPLEPDMDAAFAVSALAAAAGEARIRGFPRTSLQPDRAFVGILEAMGAEVRLAPPLLCVRRPAVLKPVSLDLRGAPDLFPVLAVLCGLARGVSRLAGAPHLRLKESDRIAVTASLLRRLGRRVRILNDGLEIRGEPGFEVRPFRFDPAGDHRLVMAAAVARAAGAPVEILHPEAADKSFPGFERIAGLRRPPSGDLLP